MAMARKIRWAWKGMEVALGMDDAGNGPILLPALSSISTREEMRPLFDRLAPSFRVVTVDWPGFGDQARPKIDWMPQVLVIGETVNEMLDHVSARPVSSHPHLPALN
jgi:hypothetical protein